MTTTTTLPRPARDYLGAWGEATLSFLDHLLPLTLGIGLPALMLGVAGHNLLDGDIDSFWTWFFFRAGTDLILTPPCVAAGLWMSRRASFFRPALGEVVIALFSGEARIFWLSVLFALVLRPSMFFFAFFLLAIPFLALGRPHRWLEGRGRLWGAGSGMVFLSALPLLIGASVAQWGLLFWDVWSLEESTPLMLGLDQIVRALLACWSWAVLFRLFRVEDGE